jgi:hypothetical protein
VDEKSAAARLTFNQPLLAGSTSRPRTASRYNAPMKYSPLGLLLLVTLAAFVSGCSHRPTRMDIEDLKKAVDDVDKHAKEIEKAGAPIGPAKAP